VTAPSIFVIGEALIDAVESGGTVVEHVGGSPANVAIGAARQGLAVHLLTAFGEDARGRAIRSLMDAASVTLAPTSGRLERTSVATATLQPDGSAVYDFDIHWEIESWTPPAAPTVVHTGSIAAFLAPGADTVAELLRSSQGASVITFDPNIRPALVRDHAAALARVEATAALADVVKLSDEDAEWLYPGASAEDVLDRLESFGCALVAMTRGSEGAIVQAHGERFAIPAVAVTVADTIGAGDSFMACLVSDIAKQGLAAVVADPVRFGTRAATSAAIVVSRVGADMATADEVDRAVENGRVALG